jgi:hypothetical protein
VSILDRQERLAAHLRRTLSAGDGAVPRQAPLSTVPAWALAAAEAMATAE